MDDNNKNDAQGNVTHLPASLWNIPDLPFGIICSFLDTSTLINLSLVCTKFNSYIKNEISLREWKRRAQYCIWPDAVYPILSPANPDRLFWRMSCKTLQKQKVLWTQNPYPLVKIVQKEYKRRTGHPLSSLLLMRDGTAYIVAKSRDLFYNKIESEHSDICKKFAHRSRILDLTILNNEIYSCCFDNEHIKSWKLNNGYLQMETSYNFDSRLSFDWPNCLSSHPRQNVFAVGSFYGYVNVFDSRSRNPVNWYKARRDRFQICTLAINSKYILSASYDNRVSVYDQRTRRFLDNIEISERVTCIKMQQDCVLIGDDVGKLHVSNPKNNFKVVNSYDVGHTRKITSVYLTHGSLITSSLDTVIISSPTNPPKHMYTLNIPGITLMDYQNGIFALFTDSDQLLIYKHY